MDSDSGRIGPMHFTKEQLSAAHDSGFITDEEYIKRCALLERGSHVKELLDSSDYPFIVTPEQLVSDRDSGLIDDRRYQTFRWFLDNGGVGDGSGLRSFRLKIATVGLKLLGRFDTFECCLSKEKCQLERRLYCVNGTLFEGCGNFRAPDAGKYFEIPSEKVDRIFGYLGFLDNKGYLGKDHSTAVGYDSDEFHLYVRTLRGTVHTKGTSEFPEFLRFLLFLLGADGI